MVTKTKKSEEDTKTKKTKDTKKEAPARATRASARTTTKKVVGTPTKKTPTKKTTTKKEATTAKAAAKSTKATTKTTTKAAPKKTPKTTKTAKTTTKSAPKKTTKTAKASPKKAAKKTTTKTTKTTTKTTKAAPKKAPAAKAAPKKAAPKRKTADEGSDTEKAKKQKTEPVVPVTDFRIDVHTGPLADVMTMGSGEVGQLGLGKTVLGRKRPTPLPELQSKYILKVVPGGLHNAVIVQNNPNDDPSDTSVWTWGCNDNAVLGRSTPAQDDVDLSMQPDICPLLEGKHIVEISTGEYHMAALTNTGTLYMWGNFKDNEGFLGYSGSQKTEQQLPQVYPKTAATTIRQVVSGHNHTIALTTQGKVLIWGFHWLGRRVSDRMKRLHLDPQPVMFHKKNGKEPKIVRVAAGGYHSFAFAEDGAIYAWGLNNNGQLGLDSNIDQGVPKEIEYFVGKNIVDIIGGMHHTIALGADGKVYTFGRGDYGQLGDGKVYEKDNKGSKIPVEVEFFNNLGDKVVNIGTGDNHCTAVTLSGAVYAWGFGSSGQIGNAGRDDDGDDANVPFKIAGPKLLKPVVWAGAGGQHTIFLVQAGDPLPTTSSSYHPPITSLTSPAATPSSSFSSTPAPATSSPVPLPPSSSPVPSSSSPAPLPSSSTPPPSTPPKNLEKKLSQRSETLI